MKGRLQNNLKNAGLTLKSWVNPFLIAIVPTILIIWSRPDTLEKYTVEHTSTMNRHSRYDATYYVDFEGDGRKEAIVVGQNILGNLQLSVFDEDNNQIEQSNLQKPPLLFSFPADPILNDLNGDGLKELLLFSLKDDSVFLNVYDYHQLRFIEQGVFVEKIGLFNDHRDVIVNWVRTAENEPQIQDVYFTLAAGFALYPRRMYHYSYSTNRIDKTGNFGFGNPRGQIVSSEQPLIFLTGRASGNTSPDYPYPYHDTCSWIMCFDTSLHQLFEPIPLGSYPSAISQVFPIGGDYMGFAYSNNSKDSSNICLKFNERGQILQKKTLPFACNELKKVIYKHKAYYVSENLSENRFFAIRPSDLQVVYPSFLKTLKHKQFIASMDIYGDAEKEAIFLNERDQSVEILDESLRHLLVLYLAGVEGFVKHLSTKKTTNGALVNVLTSTKTFGFEIRSNVRYWWRYLSMLFTYVIVSVFIGAIMYLQHQRLQRRLRIEEQIASLQLQNIRNQLDPHFTFNALNSVGAAIYKDDRKKAYDLFQRFTRLIRTSLLASEHIFRSLNEEVKFIEDYVAFQNIRFANRYHLKIQIQPTVNPSNIQIPKLLLQGFVENAIKHAFFEVDRPCNILITVERKDKKINIVVEDDGIGIHRSKTNGYTTGTQKGEEITMNQVDKINKVFHTDISIQISDRSDQHPKQSGTRIVISL